jgi:hypothetical protein
VCGSMPCRHGVGHAAAVQLDQPTEDLPGRIAPLDELPVRKVVSQQLLVIRRVEAEPPWPPAWA